MLPTDPHPPYTILQTENTQYCLNSPLISPSIQSLASDFSGPEYSMTGAGGNSWEVVQLQSPAPVHNAGHMQRSKSVTGLMRRSTAEMETSASLDDETSDAESSQRPRSAAGFAQYTGQNMW